MPLQGVCVVTYLYYLHNNFYMCFVSDSQIFACVTVMLVKN